ncbi:hypothetical protein MHU86_25099 [Fragilaria crotonensis]|nr:hypothetical protein MHU86_25099 [Fragilaria crotonensis]
MPSDPEDAARAAAILYERTRILAERAEDALLAEAGGAPILRDPIPVERAAIVAIVESELDAEDAARIAAIAAIDRSLTATETREEAEESARVAATILALESEIALLRRTGSTAPSIPTAPPVAASTFGSTSIIDSSAPATPFSGAFNDLLGDFLPIERTQVELEYGCMQVISKADRLRLSASEKNKIYTTFIKGIASKFKASSTIVGLDEISTIENIMSFSQLRTELQKHITSVSAHSVFLILKFDTTGALLDPDSHGGAPTNILSANIMPPIHEVERSTFFHYKRGTALSQENLSWSYEAIRNSCDKDLQGIIDAKMLKYQTFERFGPLYYYELVQQMTTVDSKAVRAITQELTSLKVVDQEGQSIAKVAKIIRSTIIWLEMVNMLPPDIDAIVYDILETCTVSDFQLFLKTLSTNASLNRVRLSVNDLLNNAEEHYRSLILSKRWDAVGHQGSSFQAQRAPTNPNSGGRRERTPITMPPWNRTAPTAGEPNERPFENKIFKWCGTCERWFFGDRGHFTHEHVPGFVVNNNRRPRGAHPHASGTGAPIPTPSANLVVPYPEGHSDNDNTTDLPASHSLPFNDFERRILILAVGQFFRSSCLGRLLRALILRWVLSRLFIFLSFISYLPFYLFIISLHFLNIKTPVPPPTPYVCRYIDNNERVHERGREVHPNSCPNVLPSSLRLLSDDCRLPLCLHSHIQRSDFDPDFVAALLSRGPDDEVVDIILDTGCTFAITPDKRDFIQYHEGSVGKVQTVNGPTPMAGYGLVRWTLISEDGTHLHLVVPCHHVPASKVRLLSPQDFCLYKGFDHSLDQFGGNSNYFWMNADEDRTRFQCPIDPRSNLPVALAKLPCHKQGQCSQQVPIEPHPTCISCQRQAISTMSVFEETNQNITAAQKDLLLWHARLGHLGFAHVQQLMRPRTIEKIFPPSSNICATKPADPCITPKHSSASTCKPPLCAACQIARAKRRSTETSTTTTHHEQLLKIGDLTPGSCVSIDQYESSVRGRLSTGRGKGTFGSKYAGGTIFCDHASGFIQCFHQVSLRASDTLISKRAFERIAKTCGKKIHSYHGDNGIFKVKEFTDALAKDEQELKLSGVGAHHQNGVAERAIRTVTERARAMMQHSFLHWPEEFQVELWPFALDHACWMYNHTPHRSHGWAPIEIFCGSSVSCQHLQRVRVWGCPGYVLSPTLQDGKKIPKWAPKARRGQFLGFSRNHSSTIGLMRNLQTDSISPQFHVVFDELFTTVHSVEEDDGTWVELFVSERDYYGPDEEEEDDDVLAFPEIDPDWLPLAELRPDPAPAIIAPEDVAPPPHVPGPADAVQIDPIVVDQNDAIDQPPCLHPHQDTPGRPRRIRRPNQRVFGDEWTNYTVQLTPSSRTLLGHIVPTLSHDDLFLHSLDWDAPFSEDYASYHAFNELHIDPYTDEVEWFHPFTLGAKASSADTPTLRDIQRLSPQEIDLWYEAMDIELDALRKKDAMSEINRSDVPKGHQIIRSTWAFRRKRRPNGEIHKLKARFVVRGDLQVLDASEGTYSPVVDWSTVRLLFILTVAQQLKSTTIDFNAAFVQSDLPEPIYLELPPGYSVPGEDKVYKVIKSLYGDIRAAKLWYQHLSAALVDKLGFQRSTIDSCLYFRDGLVFAFYVDDGIIVSSDDDKILHFIDQLRECRFDLGVEDDYAGYLGVDIIMQPDGTILMLQTGLIERILADFGLTDSASSKITPASEVLSPHKESAPFDHSFNYRSVLGKIMYLSSNTRCELSLSNHQCARFSIDPRTPHGIALKRIGRYLLGTRDKGMIIRPTKDITLDCYADADFAGLFASHDPNDPKSVKSRSGFVITLGGIPVSWTSKLQTETALSTMEAEYISLSQALRVLLPLRIVLDEVTTSLHLKQDSHSVIKSTIFEDNQACLALANSDPPKMTPRSKSIAVKYHWFREHLEPGLVEIAPIASAEQLADIFTKPLGAVPFVYLRKKLLGW